MPGASSTLLWCLSASVLATVDAYSAHQRWVFVNNQLRYKLNSAYCASIREGKVADGSDIILWHCGKNNVEQQWTVDGGYIRLKSNPKYCMSVREGRAGDGSDIILWDCGNTIEYQWQIENEHVKFGVDHRFWLSVREDAVQDGANLILWSGHSAGYEFLFDSSSPHIKLKAKQSLCVSVRQGHENMDSGKDLIMWGCGPSDSRGQAWELVGGQIRSKTDPTHCLGVREGLHKDGADILLWECVGTEEFVVSNQRIRVKHSQDYCLMVEDSRTGEGSKLKLWHCDAPDEEDKEGLGVHLSQHAAENEVQPRWKFGGDGGVRSMTDPRYCASVSQGKVANGYPVIMWHCGMHEGGNNHRDQAWKIEGNYIKLKSDPTFCMSVREGKAGSGSDIILWECGDSFSPWTIEGKPSEGAIVKYRSDPQFHLAIRQDMIKDGANLILWPSYANPFQWVFDKETIKLKIDPSLCISIREAKLGDGSNVILWTCGSGTNDEMQWTMSSDHIMPSSDQDRCLSVREGRVQDGTDIIIWPCHDDDYTQRWIVMGGRIRLKSQRDYCLTIRPGHAGDGSDLIIWSCDEKVDTDDEL